MNITKELIKEGIMYYRNQLIKNDKFRNRVKKCPICNHNIADRNVTLYKELIEALYKIYRWCGERSVHEFQTKEIVHLLSKNNYARFGDLVRFGGIVYKPKDSDGNTRKAWFGINMARAREFFAGVRKIPVQITLNQITNEIVNAKYVTINEFPKLINLLDKDGLYDYKIDIIDSPLNTTKNKLF